MNKTAAELVEYGTKIAHAGLVAGAGGNISARDGEMIWLKPSGLAMDDMTVEDLCGIRIADGKQLNGPHRPTSEVNMHLTIYRLRPDIDAVFHTHSPWASGIISSGAQIQPMFAEFICDLGITDSLPYITPTTDKLAAAVGEKMKKCDTLFMENHGILAGGCTMKQAYYRCVVVEDAAKSQLAALIAGKPRFLNAAQINELRNLDAAKHRINMMEGNKL